MCCKSASWSEMYFQFVGRRDIRSPALVVVAVAMGIGSIGKKFHMCGTGQVERSEVDGQVAGSPVAYASDKPFAAFTARCNDILAHLGIENDGFVPDSRNGSDEIGAFLLAAVVARRIAKHVERRI